jgi:hypothetical protein
MAQGSRTTVDESGSTEPPGERWRDEVASRIADELRPDPSTSRRAKVSSLLHAFRTQGIHCDIGDMKRALSAQGVVLDSPPPAISRRDVLDLRLDPDADADHGEPPLGVSGVRVSMWSPGLVGTFAPLPESDEPHPVPTGGVLWFDVDPRGDDPSEDDVRELTDRLKTSCIGLNKIMVRDLLTPDVQPKAETYGDERTGVRTVSIPALIAREVPDDDDGFDGVDEQLIVQMVELVIGPGWLITCWHRSRTLVGGGEVDHGPPLLREPFLGYVSYRWSQDAAVLSASAQLKDARDLAAYLARSLVATYGASLRRFQGWVSSWEVEFYKTLGDGANRVRATSLKSAAVEISNFLSLVGEFSRSVNAFKLAGEEMPNSTWFADHEDIADGDPEKAAPSKEGDALALSVDAATTKLAQLSEEIRADMDLLMLQSQARQQESSERLQGYLGKVTGLVLVPTFVAGLFGANTALPEGGTWAGFEIMVVLMVVSAAISYMVIRKLMR